jgi:hypothetical protein
VCRGSSIRAPSKEARAKSTPEYLFPKLAQEQGAVPRILDAPPPIFHPTAEQAPGLENGYREAFAAYRRSLRRVRRGASL